MRKGGKMMEGGREGGRIGGRRGNEEGTEEIHEEKRKVVWRKAILRN